MNLRDRLLLAARAFRASPQLATRVECGIEERPDTMHYENLYATSGAVYACIKRRADAYSRPILRVYRTKDGKSTEVLDHPLRKLLDRVNPFWTRIQLWRQTETDLLWHGNALWALESLGGTQPAEIWRMRPDWVRVVPDKHLYIKGYLYQVDGIDYSFTPNEVIHFRYANPLHEYWGLSPLSAARYAAELGIDATKFNRNFFLNASTAATALVSKVALTKDQADDLTRRWEAAFVGVSRAHKTAVLSPDLTVERLSINQRDAEWGNAMKWSLSEVARVYGVPEPLIGEEKAVYKNIKEAEATLWHETLIPELVWIEEIINTELVPLYGDSSLSVVFDLTMIEAVQDDVNLMVDRYAKLLGTGVLTINEVRRREKFGNDVPWGDVAWMPLNTSPAGSAPPPTQTEALNRIETALRALRDGVDGGTGIVLHTPSEKPAEDDLRDFSQARQMDFELSDQMESFLIPFFEKESKAIAKAYSRSTRQMGYDWDRWRQLEKPIYQATQQQAEDAAERAFAEVEVLADFNQENIRAADWARENAAEQVTNITNETRNNINAVVTKGVEEGMARDKIANAIIENQSFTPYRARMIARTETQRAFNKGNLMGYKESGAVNGKEWLDMEDGVCTVCRMNADAGVIGLNDYFPSGHDAPPAHPHCKCRILPDLRDREPSAEDFLPPMSIHGRVSTSAQKRIENSLLSMPRKSLEGLKEVHLYERKGKVMTISGQKFRVGGNYVPDKQIINIFEANTTSKGAIDYILHHEIGHHAWRSLPETVKGDFSTRIAWDGGKGVSQYADSWLKKSFISGRNENFAECCRIFTSGIKEDIQSTVANFPHTSNIFAKIWRDNLGGAI